MGNALAMGQMEDSSESENEDDDSQQVYAAVMEHMLKRQASRARARTRARERTQDRREALQRRTQETEKLLKRPRITRLLSSSATENQTMAFSEQALLETSQYLEPRERLKASGACRAWLFLVRNDARAWPKLTIQLKSKLDGPGVQRLAHILNLHKLRELGIDDGAPRSDPATAATYKSLFDAILPATCLRSLSFATNAPLKVHVVKNIGAIGAAGVLSRLSLDFDALDAERALKMLNSMSALKSLTLRGKAAYVSLADVTAALHPDATLHTVAISGAPPAGSHCPQRDLFLKDEDRGAAPDASSNTAAIAQNGGHPLAALAFTLGVDISVQVRGGTAAPNDDTNPGGALDNARVEENNPNGGGDAGNVPTTRPRRFGLARAFPRLRELAVATTAYEMTHPGRPGGSDVGSRWSSERPALRPALPPFANLKVLTLSLERMNSCVGEPVAKAIATACPALEDLAVGLAHVQKARGRSPYDQEYLPFIQALDLATNLRQLHALTFFDVELMFELPRTSEGHHRFQAVRAADVRTLVDAAAAAGTGLARFHLALFVGSEKSPVLSENDYTDPLAVSTGLVNFSYADFSKRLLDDLKEDRSFLHGRVTLRVSGHAPTPRARACDSCVADTRHRLKFGHPNFGGVLAP